MTAPSTHPTRRATRGGDDPDRPLHVAYVMSRFPKISETFVVYEMEAVRAAGLHVSCWPLWRERAEVVHPEARAWVDRARFQPTLSAAILAANLRTLRRQPLGYLRTLLAVVVGTIRSPRFLAGGLAAFPKVVAAAEAMEAERVDHVHCHFASHPALAGYVVHRLTGIPFSFTAHGSDLHRDQTMLDTKVRAAAFVAAISEDNARLIRDRAPGASTPIEVRRCGVDTEAFRPPTDRDDPAGPLRLLIVGTIHEVKGHRPLVQAVDLAVRRGIDVRLDVVGDGPDRAEIEAAAAALGERVRFHGTRTRPEVIDAVRSCDVLVVPSVPTADGRREGIPVVAMEGMAAARPVIASRLSGIPELVLDGRTGMLVRPGDVEGLADAIGHLAAHPELRRRLGDAGRARVEEAFDLAANARDLAARFVEVAS